MLTYPNNYASYPVPVRQFRLLPYRLLQYSGPPKPPCGLLMVTHILINFYCVRECFAFPGVTPAHEELSPSGLSFIQRTLLNLPFKAHTSCDTQWPASAFANAGSFLYLSGNQMS